MRNVLIVGLGFIGKPKASIYLKHGFKVYYSDTDTANIKHKRDFPEYHLYEEQADVSFDVIDICVPTKFHISKLEYFIKRFPTALFLVEKPLCSNRKDLLLFTNIVRQYQNTKIVYSENYTLASPLNEISRLLVEKDLHVKSLKIVFSKDRRRDILQGRTVDYELEGFGMEIPHALMLVTRLGVSLVRIASMKEEDLIMGNDVLKRQGSILLQGISKNGQKVEIFQSLQGERKWKKPYFVEPGKDNINAPYRTLEVDCGEGHVIAAQFEPIEGLKRFLSRVMYIENGQILESMDIVDNSLNMLVTHVLAVLEDKESINRYLMPEYAIKVTERLLDLSDRTKQRKGTTNL